MIKKLQIIPAGEYEVIVNRVIPKTSVNGTHYMLCYCDITDEGDLKGRRIFYSYVRPTVGLPSSLDEIEKWTPRYAIVILAHASRNGVVYPEPRRFVII